MWSDVMWYSLSLFLRMESRQLTHTSTHTSLLLQLSYTIVNWLGVGCEREWWSWSWSNMWSLEGAKTRPARRAKRHCLRVNERVSSNQSSRVQHYRNPPKTLSPINYQPSIIHYSTINYLPMPYLVRYELQQCKYAPIMTNAILSHPTLQMYNQCLGHLLSTAQLGRCCPLFHENLPPSLLGSVFKIAFCTTHRDFLLFDLLSFSP